jgi:hypothetical protein
MKNVLPGIFAVPMLCGVFLAPDTTAAQSNGATPQSQQNPGTTQSAQSSSSQASGALRIAPGSVIPVQLTKSVDAKKVKAGDEVEAKVTQDLKAGNGEVVVPKDTKMVGHVTEAQARTEEQKESQVGIAFDHAVIKNGGDVPLPMSIQAIIAPSALNADNNNIAGRQGAGQPVPAPSAGGGVQGNNGGRSTGMGGMPTQAPTSSTGGEWPTNAQTATNVHEPITGSTQGVLGISDLRLSSATNIKQGSVVSSEKSNVKLESGTLMLLRVNQ